MLQAFIICFSGPLFSQSIGSDGATVEKIDSKIESLKMELSSCEDRMKVMAELGHYSSAAFESVYQKIDYIKAQIVELENLRKGNSAKSNTPTNDLEPASEGNRGSYRVAEPVILKRADFLTYPPDKQKQMLGMKSVYIIVE
jgi:hypothetical protein